MKTRRSFAKNAISLLLLGTLPATVLSVDILKTSGFSSCLPDAEIQVNRMDVQYDRKSSTVNFDVAGTSSKKQNVTASLVVTAYGKEVYKKDFNPCDKDTKVEQLCPVPAGNFAAQGSQAIPANYASVIPSIAFQVPDLDGEARLELKATQGGKDLACIQSTVTNGKTANVAGVSYMAAGLAGAALLMTSASAIASAGGTSGSAPSPSFGEVIGWFQSIAMNGMLSVNYPPVYRSFTKNFAFSGGLIQWNSMQTTIDNFRERTGGNLTEDSVAYLKNATLYNTDSSSLNAKNLTARGISLYFEDVMLDTRELKTNVNGTQSTNGGSSNSTNPQDSKTMHYVHGIQGYVEQLMIPQANTFMTVLLIFAIVIAAITLGILLLKVILETWALFGTFPKKLTSFRKRYWGLLARTVTNLILLLYGVWVLYCVFQFTHGDSWAAKTLAGVTLAIFTAILGFFTFRIWHLAHKYKKAEGDTSALYENKETWVKYSLFYDSYKKSYWWLFVPAIIYMFAKGCVIAAGDGHGLAQTAGQLIVESLMMILLLWHRPYVTKAGNWINIVIQVVRVLSVICILVFVEQLGIAQSTKTVTGVVLIAVQSILTGVLAILIAVNALIMCCRMNPHRKRRKEAEKLNRDLDNLTPLDARNSLLMEPGQYKDSAPKGSLASVQHTGTSKDGSEYTSRYRDYSSPDRRFSSHDELTQPLARSGVRPAYHDARRMSDSSTSSSPPPVHRQPTVPNMGYRGVAY
ncbi:MAG: hypothetical protein M1835_004289 [Candelina submexicana]|nr:MAG: hypothetical protein M1835_004289 [Candelina submexicana]